MEKWKEIKEFTGYYISNLGNVKKSVVGGGFVPVHIFIQRINGKKPICKFCVKTKRYVQQLCVHRLVAQYFCTGTGKFVMHRDGDVFNNVYSNLYFTDKVPHPKDRSTRKREVEQYSFANCFVGRYQSITEASSMTGFSVSSICDACRGKTKSCGGYKWKYSEQNKVK